MRKQGKKSRDIIDRDAKVMSALTRPYELVVDHAEGSTIFDVDGNKYIDFASSVAVMNIGYNNKKVREAVCGQMEKWFTAVSPISMPRYRSSCQKSSAG